MSQKQLKPTLTGQRIRIRKRDENKNKKLDPETFRDEVVVGLKAANGDFGEILNFLEQAGHRLEYNRYGVTLIDVLLAGNIVTPGGAIEDESRWDFCILEADSQEILKSFHDVLYKLMRRYKYLLKTFANHIVHLLKFIPTWPEKYVNNFADFIGYCYVDCSILSLKALESLYADHLVKEDHSINFVTKVFKKWLAESEFESFSKTLRKSGIVSILDFFPENRRKEEIFEEHFTSAGLEQLVTYYKQKKLTTNKNELKSKLLDILTEEEMSQADLIALITNFSKEQDIPSSQILSIVWPCILDCLDRTKSAETLEKSIVSHLKTNSQLVENFSTSGRSQLNCLNIIQTYCYENMDFMKHLKVILFTLYNCDVLAEEAIIKWYKDSHVSKGWSVFQTQLLPFVTWLESAEEDSSDEE